MALAYCGSGCSSSSGNGPPYNILGDAAHPTGRRWYPPGVPVEVSIPGPTNTAGLYILLPRELHHLMLQP